MSLCGIPGRAFRPECRFHLGAKKSGHYFPLILSCDDPSWSARLEWNPFRWCHSHLRMGEPFRNCVVSDYSSCCALCDACVFEMCSFLCCIFPCDGILENFICPNASKPRRLNWIDLLLKYFLYLRESSEVGGIIVECLFHGKIYAWKADAFFCCSAHSRV